MILTTDLRSGIQLGSRLLPETVLVQEPAYALLFATATTPWRDWQQWITERLEEGYFLVQERIAIGTDEGLESKEARQLDRRRVQPWIFALPAGWPAHFSAVFLRPCSTRAEISRAPEGFGMRAGGTHWFFSEPMTSLARDPESAFDEGFLAMERGLHLLPGGTGSLLRTWLFLHRMERDYNALNQARARAFKRWWPDQQPILPASTGVGAGPGPFPLLGAQYWTYYETAFQPETAVSPLQPEPTTYGVLFSRARRISLQQHRMLIISGTASIDACGASVHESDLRLQARQTLGTLKALLNEQGAGWKDVAQAAVYLRDAEDRAAMLEEMENEGVPLGRFLMQQGQICRPELLCEIEILAIL